MQARVKWLDHMSFVGESGSGHSVVLDGSPEHGGRNLGIRPMVVDVEVSLDAQRAKDIPHVFTAIKAHFKVWGHGLSEKHVERAVNLSAEKYCSATKMLEKSADITYSWEIIDAPT
jgi:putative redox protein